MQLGSRRVGICNRSCPCLLVVSTSSLVIDRERRKLRARLKAKATRHRHWSQRRDSVVRMFSAHLTMRYTQFAGKLNNPRSDLRQVLGPHATSPGFDLQRRRMNICCGGIQGARLVLQNQALGHHLGKTHGHRHILLSFRRVLRYDRLLVILELVGF